MHQLVSRHDTLLHRLTLSLVVSLHTSQLLTVSCTLLSQRHRLHILLLQQVATRVPLGSHQDIAQVVRIVVDTPVCVRMLPKGRVKRVVSTAHTQQLRTHTATLQLDSPRRRLAIRQQIVRTRHRQAVLIRQASQELQQLSTLSCALRLYNLHQLLATASLVGEAMSQSILSLTIRLLIRVSRDTIPSPVVQHLAICIIKVAEVPLDGLSLSIASSRRRDPLTSLAVQLAHLLDSVSVTLYLAST